MYFILVIIAAPQAYSVYNCNHMTGQIGSYIINSEFISFVHIIHSSIILLDTVAVPCHELTQVDNGCRSQRIGLSAALVCLLMSA